MRSLLSDDHDDRNSLPVHHGSSGGILQPDVRAVCTGEDTYARQVALSPELAPLVIQR